MLRIIAGAPLAAGRLEPFLPEGAVARDPPHLAMKQLADIVEDKAYMPRD
ncbi:MAG: hypothetical protein HC841_04050 [Verrucomicrobiae bacterium]|nr:hypothetical protein [Verrucomicrobiae bacterium]